MNARALSWNEPPTLNFVLCPLVHIFTSWMPKGKGKIIHLKTELIRKSDRILAFAFLAIVVGCLPGGPDQIGISGKLEWKSPDSLSMCPGETLMVPVVKYIVDSAANTWKEGHLDTNSIVIRILDPRVIATSGHLSIIAKGLGTTSISDIDTTDKNSTSWRNVTVHACK